MVLYSTVSGQLSGIYMCVKCVLILSISLIPFPLLLDGVLVCCELSTELGEGPVLRQNNFTILHYKMSVQCNSGQLHMAYNWKEMMNTCGKLKGRMSHKFSC